MELVVDIVEKFNHLSFPQSFPMHDGDGWRFNATASTSIAMFKTASGVGTAFNVVQLHAG